MFLYNDPPAMFFFVSSSEVSQDAPDGNKDLDVELAHSYDILADMVFGMFYSYDIHVLVDNGI